MMISRSPWCSTAYSCPCSRAADEPQRALGPVGIDQVDLVGLVVVGIDQDESADCVWPTPT